MEITVVTAEDWCGMYINGALECEGHSLSWRDVVEAFRRRDSSVIVVEPAASVSNEWIENIGYLPAKLADVVFEAP